MLIRRVALLVAQHFAQEGGKVRFGARRFGDEVEHGRGGRVQQMCVPGKGVENDELVAEI
jgi:hypothetical protein